MRNKIESPATMPRTFWFASRLSVLVAATLMGSAGRNLYAAFEDSPMSAQAAAMGGSSLASQNDPANLFLNPAEDAGLKSPEAYLMYNQLYTGMSGVGNIGQSFVAFGVPTKIGTVGFGFSDFQASGLLEQRVIAVTFARKLFDNVQIGMTGKYLYQRYMIGSDPSAQADPVFSNGTSRGAPSLDIGLTDSLTSSLQIGLSVRNINQPNVGLMTTDQVPREAQAGLSYNIEPWALRITADCLYQSVQAGVAQQQIQPDIGLEKSLADGRFMFRVGANIDQLSGGIGIKFGAIGIDYTFLLPLAFVAGNSTTEMIDLHYRFGETEKSSRKSEQ